MELAELPEKVEIHLRTKQRSVYWTTSRLGASQRLQSRAIVFTPAEYEALALATEEDRVWRVDHERWLKAKVSNPHWRLTPQEAIAGAWGLLEQTRLHPPEYALVRRPLIFIGEVWRRLELEFVGIRYESDIQQAKERAA